MSERKYKSCQHLLRVDININIIQKNYKSHTTVIEGGL